MIDGDFVKEAAPRWEHQGIVLGLAMRALAVVGRHRVLISPADLVIDRWNVLQPDVLVFSEDVRGAQDKGVLPALVAEVLSPGTEARDRGVKCSAYLRAGIGEVWLVDPAAGEIEVRTSAGATRYAGDVEAVSGVVAGFRVSWRALAD